MGAVLSRTQLAALFPRARPGHIDAFVERHEALFRKYGLDRNLFRAHFFLAQIGHESGGLSVESENLNYSAERLMQVWPKRFPTLEAAAPYARNPEKLGNFTYANRNGNGPAASGDGYRFRGRGYVQLTGREGYREVGKIVDVGLDGSPDKVRRVLTALPSKKLQPDAALAILIQKALRAKGYEAIGAADGLIGQRTVAAIADWRVKKGLGAGLVDDLLLGGLGIALP